MQKILFCALCCLIYLAAPAQTYDDVHKGDIIDINGVKALVFQIDDEGHGTAMAVKALRGKKNAWCTNLKYLKKLPATSNADGEENTKAVLEYIKSSNLDITQFPAFEWCQKLGKGWYIPSWEEMKDFVNYYLGNEQEFDWDSEEEFDANEGTVTPKALNEKMVDAGGIPFLGNAIPGSGLTVGVYTSTMTDNYSVYIYQYNSQKNNYRFRVTPVNQLDLFTIGRAFHKF